MPIIYTKYYYSWPKTEAKLVIFMSAHLCAQPKYRITVKLHGNSFASTRVWLFVWYGFTIKNLTIYLSKPQETTLNMQRLGFQPALPLISAKIPYVNVHECPINGIMPVDKGSWRNPINSQRLEGITNFWKFMGFLPNSLSTGRKLTQRVLALIAAAKCSLDTSGCPSANPLLTL